MRNENLSKLWDIGFSTIQELETAEGIMASGKCEIYGCVFGRDALITSLKLLKVYKETDNQYFLDLVEKVLLNLAKLQGKEINIESGEQPGKCIHEYRVDKHDHLTKNILDPWFVYTDGTMKNYDSVDSTPLFLITIFEYFTITDDKIFLEKMYPNIFSALDWICDFSDSNNDGFIDYGFHVDRKFGGLKTQSWMDSHDSIFHEDNSQVVYPIAPAEVQSYTYVALLYWGKFLNEEKYLEKAKVLKENFNKKFVSEKDGEFAIAFAIDGNGKKLNSPRSSMGHCLWKETILEEKYITLLAERLMKEDSFEPTAGIRTLSKNSKFFQANSYHNGSIWPHDTAIIIEGLENFGFHDKAELVRKALLNSFEHFQTPLELFVFNDGKHQDYCGTTGQKSCQKQAWSAASLLAILSPLISTYETISPQIETVQQ